MSAGADALRRPSTLAGGQARSESALLHGLDELAGRIMHPEVLVFVQCTSPFVDPKTWTQLPAWSGAASGLGVRGGET